jgi:hypothetical protein
VPLSDVKSANGTASKTAVIVLFPFISTESGFAVETTELVQRTKRNPRFGFAAINTVIPAG